MNTEAFYNIRKIYDAMVDFFNVKKGQKQKRAKQIIILKKDSLLQFLMNSSIKSLK